jgi:hypothetical protein
MPAYSQKDPIISDRLRSNPYPAIATAVDPRICHEMLNFARRPVLATSSAGSSARNANRATQHHVRKRSEVLRRPARIRTSLRILAYFATSRPGRPIGALTPLAGHGCPRGSAEAGRSAVFAVDFKASDAAPPPIRGAGSSSSRTCNTPPVVSTLDAARHRATKALASVASAK